MDGLKANQLQGVDMNDICWHERRAVLPTLIILLKEIDFVNWIFVGEFADWSLKKLENTARLVKESNYIIYARWTIIKLSSNLLAVLIVPCSSTDHPIWSQK